MAYLIGLDIGTTNTKALLYDPEQGRVIDQAALPTPTDHPAPGWSQHDPEQLWQTAAACLRRAAAGRPVAALAVSSLAEAGLPLDGRGRPLYPIIAWYDRRTEAQAAWWERQFSHAQLHAITGQRVSTSFGVNKWMWIRENEPELARRMAHWLSVPDYILWRLSGEQATDYTIASRTMLFDQRRLGWSEDLLQRAGLHPDQLPRPLPSGTPIGQITPEAASQCGLPAGVLCVLGGHDHLCATFAAGAYQPGTVADSSGTAQGLMLFLNDFLSGPSVAQAAYSCYAHVVPGRFVLKGGIKTAGGAIQWLARQLAGPHAADDALPYDRLEAEAQEGIGRRAGPLWLPHFIGAGPPESDRYSRAALIGVQVEHNRGDIFRALLEGLAFSTLHCLRQMQSLAGQKLERAILMGGTTRIRLLAQIKADVLQLPAAIPGVPEAAACGAALLAGLGAGLFASPAEAVRSLRYDHTLIEPDAERAVWYAHIYERIYAPLYQSLRQAHHAMAELSGEKRPAVPAEHPAGKAQGDGFNG